MIQLVNQMREGNRHALARLFTLLERDTNFLTAIMREVHPHVHGAYCVGITGPPGVGKSTIVDGLVRTLRNQELSVGVLAVDPTSPFTGGAVLGDRIRMQDHYLDDRVFIRSLATRGVPGGLSRVTAASVKLMDASGKDVVLVESVGVGQTELDVRDVADTIVVTLAPEAGDAVQVMKAGLMEIADLFVVNKADREGAHRLVSAIRAMITLGAEESLWKPRVLTTQAHKGVGLQTVYKAILDHRRMLEETSLLEPRRREKQVQVFVETLKDAVAEAIPQLIAEDQALESIASLVRGGELDPYTAADQALNSDQFLSRFAAQYLERPKLGGFQSHDVRDEGS